MKALLLLGLGACGLPTLSHTRGPVDASFHDASESSLDGGGLGSSLDGGTLETASTTTHVTGPTLPCPNPIAIAPASGAHYIQDQVDAAPDHSCFLLSGVHRNQTIQPKVGDQFVGTAGATLNGANILDSFVQENGLFAMHGIAPLDHTAIDSQTPGGGCMTRSVCEAAGHCDASLSLSGGYSRCQYPETVYVDDVALWSAEDIRELTPSSGKFFYDFAASTVYLGDDPAGHRVEIAHTKYAFIGAAAGKTPIADVSISGLLIEKYAAPTQTGAIQASATSNWLIQGNEIRLVHAQGIETGAGTQVIGNWIHHNGLYGLAGTGSAPLVAQNEIDHNNFAGYSYSWGAGGFKFTRTDGLIVRCNFSHDNIGPGMWTDVNNRNTLYERNLVVDNYGIGLFEEVSHTATIRNNILARNSKTDAQWLYGGQIVVSSSDSAEVSGNRVEVDAAGGNGITVLDQVRCPQLCCAVAGQVNCGGVCVNAENSVGICSKCGPTASCEWGAGSEHARVHDNDVTYLGAPGLSGAGTDYPLSSGRLLGMLDDSFNSDHYHAASATTSHWAWGPNYDFAALQSHGEEVLGSVDDQVTPDATPLGVPLCN